MTINEAAQFRFLEASKAAQEKASDLSWKARFFTDHGLVSSIGQSEILARAIDYQERAQLRYHMARVLLDLAGPGPTREAVELVPAIGYGDGCKGL